MYVKLCVVCMFIMVIAKMLNFSTFHLLQFHWLFFKRVTCGFGHIFTEEILNGEFHYLCNSKSSISKFRESSKTQNS